MVCIPSGLCCYVEFFDQSDLKLLPNRSEPNARFAGTVASNGLHRRSQKYEMWVFVHQYFGHLSTNILEICKHLDEFRAVVARNLNETLEWRECCVSCYVERRGRIDWMSFS